MTTYQTTVEEKLDIKELFMSISNRRMAMGEG
jgi:hypothetical protein